MTDNASRRRLVEGYEPRWDIDRAYGEQGQLWVADVAKALQSGSVEVKRDGRWHQTNNLYVEYECRRAGVWRKSGIAATDADLYTFVLGDLGAALVIETPLLVSLCRELFHRNEWYRVEETSGSHPTRGIKLPLGELIELLKREQRLITQRRAS
jgi:hypothetical protein